MQQSYQEKAHIKCWYCIYESTAILNTQIHKKLGETNMYETNFDKTILVINIKSLNINMSGRIFHKSNSDNSNHLQWHMKLINIS